MQKLGKSVMDFALREPSLGFKIWCKRAVQQAAAIQVVPMEDINLHFTGDFTCNRRCKQPSCSNDRQPHFQGKCTEH